MLHTMMPPLLGKEIEDLLFVSCSMSISQSVKWWNACQHWCLSSLLCVKCYRLLHSCSHEVAVKFLVHYAIGQTYPKVPNDHIPSCSEASSSRRWRCYDHLTCQELLSHWHSITSQKAWILCNTAIRKLNSVNSDYQHSQQSHCALHLTFHRYFTI